MQVSCEFQRIVCAWQLPELGSPQNISVAGLSEAEKAERTGPRYHRSIQRNRARDGIMAEERDARVVLSSRNEIKLRERVEQIRLRGGQATAIVADVANPASVDAIAEHAVREYGGFDTWINERALEHMDDFLDTRLNEKHRVFGINFWGVLWVLGCVRHLMERGGPIINIGSGASDVALPSPRHA
jgi:NAD(P)-dependent dehydrogenase (short-subunit alcohol dehydrogenase family)